jgi:fructosamine-3-kinase
MSIADPRSIRWSEIAAQISASRGTLFTATNPQKMGGGCINYSYTIGDQDDRYFIKLNQPNLLEMFTAEAAGLEAIAQTQVIAVPQPVCSGIISSHSYLVLTYLDLGQNPTNNWQKLGQQLATLHQAPAPQQFGWHRHNNIGSTPQHNDWQQDWAEFFCRQRLGYQLQLAGQSKFPHSQKLLAVLPSLLNHQPAVSLVHGDLWGGNAGFTTNGQPVIFDPATYYGDREVDLAMTELFGGFPAAFYQGYEEVYHLAAGYQQRKVIYNLYHVLNHYNLFGSSYQSQANSMITQILGWGK